MAMDYKNMTLSGMFSQVLLRKLLSSKRYPKYFQMNFDI